jgi:hypothetical protein
MLKEWLSGAFGRGKKSSDIGRKLAPYLEDADACPVLRLVLENPGITIESLSIRAHMDTLAVAGCLKRMADDGLVTVEAEGGQAGYHIAADAKAAVVQRLPLNYQCPGMLRE